MRKKTKKPQVYSIFFSVPLFIFDVLIIVGARSKEDIRLQFKKQRVGFKQAEFWLNNKNIEWMLTQEAGSLVPEGELSLIYLFKDWHGTNDDLRTLVHEVSHMVDSIAEYKNLLKETEARAYLSEYLFDTIRKSL